jgi:hypothetical protein
MEKRNEEIIEAIRKGDTVFVKKLLALSLLDDLSQVVDPETVLLRHSFSFNNLGNYFFSALFYNGKDPEFQLKCLCDSRPFPIPFCLWKFVFIFKFRKSE